MFNIIWKKWVQGGSVANIWKNIWGKTHTRANDQEACKIVLIFKTVSVWDFVVSQKEGGLFKISFIKPIGGFI